MKVTRFIASLALCWIALVVPSYAAGGNYPWADSVQTEALNSGPSLQEILVSLGYSVNVATDEVGLTVFAPPSGGTNGEAILRYRSSSSTAVFGSYRKGIKTSSSELFAVGVPTGTKANQAFAPGDSLGFHVGPTLYDDTWYSQPSLNWDSFQHAKVFRTGTVGKYVIAWEDLPDGGDQDYNDYVIELSLKDSTQSIVCPVTLAFVGDSIYSICQLDYLCLQINSGGGIGNLSLSRLINGVPTLIATGPSPLSSRYCFLPSSYADTTYSLIFRLQDEAGSSLVDTFSIQVRFQSSPELTVINDLIDTTICKIDSICFSAVSAFDVDGDTITFILVDGPGVIDSTTGRICFLPTAADSAEYRFVVAASDSCCLSLGLPKEQLPCPRDTITVRVRLRLPPMLAVTDTTVNLCKPEPICFPVSASFPGGGPAMVYQDCGPGTFANNQLCFTPPGAGVYLFCFYAVDACGGFVRDTVRVTVTINLPPVANAGRDSTLSQCAPAPICWAASCSDPDADLATCTLIQGPGTYNGSQICFTPPSSGSYLFVLQATDSCGEVDLDTAIITVTLKRPPVAQIRDTVVTQCSPTQVCIPASCSDPDGDLVSCTLISPIGSCNGSSVCFTPTASGQYQFIVKATDACGLTAYDTGMVRVILNRPPQITPGGGSFTLCAPGNICVPVIASDSDGTPLVITTTMGTVVDNSICLWSGGEGRRQLAFNVTVTDPCGARATALYLVNVVVNVTPVIQVPTPVAETLCVPTQLCFDVDAVDTIMGHLTYQLQSGPGQIDTASGIVCFTPTSSGAFNWRIAVRDSCGSSDTGNVSWKIDIVPEPTPVILPPDGDRVACTGTNIGEICTPFQYDNSQPANIGVTCSNPNLSWRVTYSGGAGNLCFTPIAETNATYSFTFRRLNECHDTATSVYKYKVTYESCDSSCLILSIEQTPCVTLSSRVTVDVTLDHGRIAVGGYDLLLTYDVTAVSFVSANIGAAINRWEYFTYRLGPFGNCGGACPSGMVRLVALADMNNGAAHPPADQFSPAGAIATMTFQVTSDATFDGRVYPISFFWVDCGDNAFSTVSGDTLLVDKKIYNPEYLLWDEFDEVNFPESYRFANTGAPDECMTGNKQFPLRCIEFRNGFVCIIDSDSIDARGDINLNGMANEIADAVVFTNYFLKGLSAFTASIPGQTAATDVNADGRTLTVGDLVYLMRVIIGDAQPIPKLAPFRDVASFTAQQSAGSTTISSQCGSDIGGVYLQLKANGLSAADIVRGMGVANIAVESSVGSDLVNVIIYSDKRGAAISAGTSELLTINSACEIVHIEACDYDGNMLNTIVEKTGTPAMFELGQNYPNPFNPTTTIRISLPRPSDWTLSIVNVNGQVVKRLSGTASVGVTDVKWDATDQSGAAVASGVYFYRLEAGDFAETKKMLLMK
jgi:hypothetical protein